MPFSLKLDENLPHDAAQPLRAAGHTVTTVLEQGLGGATDEAVAEAVLREGRVFVTLDGGFADIRAYPPKAHPGLIVLRLPRVDKARIAAAMARVVQALASEDVAGRLWIVEERRIRVRS
jgi:predicted nuclease of predicted toxin-antitoxin system